MRAAAAMRAARHARARALSKDSSMVAAMESLNDKRRLQQRELQRLGVQIGLRAMCCFREVTFERGEIIQLIGQPIARVVVIRSGTVSLLGHAQSGAASLREITSVRTGLLGDESLLFQDRSPATSSLEAVAKSRVTAFVASPQDLSKLPEEHFRRLQHHAAVRNAHHQRLLSHAHPVGRELPAERVPSPAIARLPWSSPSTWAEWHGHSRRPARRRPATAPIVRLRTYCNETAPRAQRASEPPGLVQVLATQPLVPPERWEPRDHTLRSIVADSLTTSSNGNVTKGSGRPVEVGEGWKPRGIYEQSAPMAPLPAAIDSERVAQLRSAVLLSAALRRHRLSHKNDPRDGMDSKLTGWQSDAAPVHETTLHLETSALLDSHLQRKASQRHGEADQSGKYVIF